MSPDSFARGKADLEPGNPQAGEGGRLAGPRPLAPAEEMCPGWEGLGQTLGLSPSPLPSRVPSLQGEPKLHAGLAPLGEQNTGRDHSVVMRGLSHHPKLPACPVPAHWPSGSLDGGPHLRQVCRQDAWATAPALSASAPGSHLLSRTAWRDLVLSIMKESCGGGRGRGHRCPRLKRSWLSSGVGSGGREGHPRGGGRSRGAFPSLSLCIPDVLKPCCVCARPRVHACDLECLSPWGSLPHTWHLRSPAQS